jgi:hypothetical protein
MGTAVTSIVPVGYEAYVRVFHPASAAGADDAVTWRQVADWSGGTFHPLAQFEAMTNQVRPEPGPSLFDQAPFQGELAPAVCHLVVRELAKLTDTPTACHFGIWDGWVILTGGWAMLRQVGGEGDDNDRLDIVEAEVAAWQRQVARLPRFEHPNRSYLLGRGPIGVACALDTQPLRPGSWQTLGLTPQLWWPEDRAWVVASEIDFDSTIVATTVAGAEVLLDCEGPEALLVPSDGRLDEGGDEINVP